MFRYEVAVDGVPAEVGLTGEPVAVAALAYSAGVEFWAEHDEAKEPRRRTFTIVGTGHTIPAGARYIGTAPRTGEGLVWHLYEITADCRQRVTEAAGTPEADVLTGTGDRLGGMLLVVRRLMDIRSAPR